MMERTLRAEAYIRRTTRMRRQRREAMAQRAGVALAASLLAAMVYALA